MQGLAGLATWGDGGSCLKLRLEAGEEGRESSPEVCWPVNKMVKGRCATCGVGTTLQLPPGGQSLAGSLLSALPSSPPSGSLPTTRGQEPPACGGREGKTSVGCSSLGHSDGPGLPLAGSWVEMVSGEPFYRITISQTEGRWVQWLRGPKERGYKVVWGKARWEGLHPLEPSLEVARGGVEWGIKSCLPWQLAPTCPLSVP